MPPSLVIGFVANLEAAPSGSALVESLIFCKASSLPFLQL